MHPSIKDDYPLMQKIRFGILGAAKIAKKIWKAIHDSGNSIVVAVASRDMDRAQKFIDECQMDARFENQIYAFDDYEKLLASNKIDAVYIPLPTALRKEWVIKAAQAGKHIICEKPCAVNSADLEEMLSECKKHHVQFMDGVMFMHNPRLEKFRQLLDDNNSIGTIKRITSHFSFLCPPGNIRLDSKLEPLGSLGDLGWYCIRIALWIMKWEIPKSVIGKVISANQGGVPVEFADELYFDNQISVSFYSSFQENFRQWAEVNGTQGYIRVPNFVVPADNSNTIEINNTISPVPQLLSQEANMIRNFANQIASGKLNAEWPEFSLKTQRVVDQCQGRIGVKA